MSVCASVSLCLCDPVPVYVSVSLCVSWLWGMPTHSLSSTLSDLEPLALSLTDCQPLSLAVAPARALALVTGPSPEVCYWLYRFWIMMSFCGWITSFLIEYEDWFVYCLVLVPLDYSLDNNGATGWRWLWVLGRRRTVKKERNKFICSAEFTHYSFISIQGLGIDLYRGVSV